MERTRKQQKLETTIKLVAGTTLSLLVMSVLWGVVWGIMITKGAVIGGGIFLAIIIGVVLFAVLAIYHNSVVKAATANNVVSSPPLEIDKALDTGKLLDEPHLDSMLSVTERTTDLFAVGRKGRSE